MPVKTSKYLAITTGLLYACYRLVDLHARREEYKRVKKRNQSRTFVLTWTSSHPSQGYHHYEADYSVGHMAIQFEDRYVSFWPKGTNSKLSAANPAHLLSSDAQLSTLMKDIRVEKKLPDSVLIIQGLDHALMLAALHELTMGIENKTVKFQTIHNKPLQDAYNNPRKHCATAVNDILSAGGFPAKRRYFSPWSTTPGLQHLLYQAIGAHEIKTKGAKERVLRTIQMKTQRKGL